MISFKEKVFPRWLLDEIVTLYRLGIWIVTRMFLVFNVIQVVTIFAGHLGKNALAAAGLGRTFCNFTGLPISMGFVYACDTLLSQASGAGNYKRIGIIGQRVFFIIIIISLPTISLWINTEKILIALGQDPLVARYVDFPFVYPHRKSVQKELHVINCFCMYICLLITHKFNPHTTKQKVSLEFWECVLVYFLGFK